MNQQLLEPQELRELVASCNREVQSRRAKASANLAAAIEVGLADAWRASEGDLSQVDCDFVVEHLQLQHEHVGEYVIFTEGVEVIAGVERYRLKILFQSRDLGEINEYWWKLSPEQQETTLLEYQEDPETISG